MKTTLTLILLLLTISTFAGTRNRGHKAKKVKSTYFSAKHFCSNYLKM